MMALIAIGNTGSYFMTFLSSGCCLYGLHSNCSIVRNVIEKFGDLRKQSESFKFVSNRR